MIKQTKISNNATKHYNMGTEENPRHTERGEGYSDMDDFNKYHRNAKVIGVFQEVTEKAMHRDYYRYIVFYEET